MPYRILLIVSLLAITGCKTSQIASSSDLQQIRANMKSQEAAWNEGSIENFMHHYWNSPNLTFVGSRGVTKGWQQTFDNYVKSYPDKQTMGRLAFEIIELRPLGPESAYMIGKYTLFRSQDEPSGYFNLIWQNKNGRWVITSDHTGG